MFFAAWADRRSLLIDHTDKKKARAVALEVADGEEPARLVPVPEGVMVFEVFDEEGAEDDDPIQVAPLSASEDALTALEDDAPPPVMCTAESFDDHDEVLTCEKVDGHEGKHRRNGLVWP